MTRVKLGIENFVASPPVKLKGKRLGLLCNQSSTDSSFRHSRDRIDAVLPGRLTCLLSPQHGFFSEKQDNMIESANAVDEKTGIDIFSLYGEDRKPTPEMMDNLDVLLIDLQDVGTRVYTFLYTMAYCLEAAAESGKQVVVLDRPNPVGGLHIEGNLLDERLRSFVGMFPIPMRHGLTFGELALFINGEYGIGADLEVIPLSGWQRRMYFEDTGIPWVFPSPNMPAVTTTIVYAGQVILEGTNISEGRGTCLPFELCGAPYIEHDELAARLSSYDLPGCYMRRLDFEPTFNKWSGTRCSGVHVHVTDRNTFRPYRTSLVLLDAIMSAWPDNFAFKQPPYEYEYEKLPLDLILGDDELRKSLGTGADILEIEKKWQADLARFDKIRKKYFLY